MVIDLHSHTYPKSDDSFMAPDELVEAAKSAGLDGICITEHDAFWSADEIESLARRHNFLVLPGSEINTDAGHVLVFGLSRYVFGLHKLGFLEAAARKAGAVLIAAHPYRRRYLAEAAQEPEARAEMLSRAGADPLFKLCDAIEGINGRGTAEQNRFSQDLGKLLGAGVTAGSDAHRPEHLGAAATYFPAAVKNLDDLKRELKAGRFRMAELAKDS